MKNLLVICVLGLCFGMQPLASSSQTVFDYNENCKKAYTLLYDLRFIEAQKILDAEKKNHPHNGIPYYLDHYILFLKAFISEEDMDYEALKKHHDASIVFFDNAKNPSPYLAQTKAEVNMLTAFVRFKFSDYVSGALEIRRAYKLLEENNKKYPSFYPNLRGLGLIHGFIGAVPENYKWLLKLAGMNGTVQQGIGELSKLYLETKQPLSPYHYMHKEVTFVYLFSRQHLEKDPESVLPMVDELLEDNYPMTTFFACNLLYTAGKNDRAKQLLEKVNYLPDMYRFYYLDYLLGVAKLNMLDMNAEDQFNSYLSTYNGRSFLKAGYQKLAWIDLMKGDTVSYKAHLQKILKAGNDFTDEDKQAQKEAEGKEIPNVLLLKARVLFDGGNYKQALTMLAGKGIENFPSLKNKLELTYRLGRIYDKMNMEKNAIDLYQKTIQNGSKFTYYFAANSCLHLGQIYEMLNDKINAEKYYKLCLSMRNHEYQNSIDQKAKAGLNRLGRDTVKE